jgi:glycosyltransferase involved in cell wall biosynthesis
MSLLVSVHMITYNHEKYIAQAIEGVLMQETTFDYELVISDDCSPDNTLNIIKKYQELHPNIIRIINRENNIGSIGNFIDTFSYCKGKYIAICEGDDYWSNPLKLEKQIRFLEANADYTFSMGRVDMLIEKTGKIIKRNEHVNPNKKETYTLRDYLKNPFSQTSSFVFRNSNKPFPEWFHNVHAGDQSLVVIKTGISGKIKYHKDLFSIYRVNEGSISHTCSYNVYEKFLLTLKDWQSFLNSDFNVIFKKIDYKYRQYAKLSKCNILITKMYYIFKIKLIDFSLKFL